MICCAVVGLTTEFRIIRLSQCSVKMLSYGKAERQAASNAVGRGRQIEFPDFPVFPCVYPCVYSGYTVLPSNAAVFSFFVYGAVSVCVSLCVSLFRAVVQELQNL